MTNEKGAPPGSVAPFYLPQYKLFIDRVRPRQIIPMLVEIDHAVERGNDQRICLHRIANRLGDLVHTVRAAAQIEDPERSGRPGVYGFDVDLPLVNRAIGQ